MCPHRGGYCELFGEYCDVAAVASSAGGRVSSDRLRCSRMLRSVNRQLVADVSGQPVGPLSQGPRVVGLLDP